MNLPATENVLYLDELRSLPTECINRLLSEYGVSKRFDEDSDGWLHDLLAAHIGKRGKAIGQGSLQILPDGFGFLRNARSDYLSGPDDIYVSPSQIRKFDLRDGDVVAGNIRPPKDSERYFALLRVEEVNDNPPNGERIHFDDMEPFAPSDRIILESGAALQATRLVDMFAPMGIGQRGILVSPAGAGKTKLLQQVAKSVATENGSIHVFVLLIDERPEDSTVWYREMEGTGVEVIQSDFGESSSRHLDVASMVFEKSCRMVESGQDAMVIVDSLTSLARIELENLHPKKTTARDQEFASDDVNLDSLPWTRQQLALARNTNGFGSLSILATLSNESNLEQQICERLLPVANTRIVLDEQLLQRRIWPAINVFESGSDFDQGVLGDDLELINQMRNRLGKFDAAGAMDGLTTLLKDYPLSLIHI